MPAAQSSVSARPARWASAIVFTLAVLHLATPLALASRGAASINAYLTNDDTYYYLQTAWNARHLGFVTFDGITPTNGVQFLWFGLVYLASFAVDDKAALLRMVVTAGVVLAALPYVLIWRLYRQTIEPRRSLLLVTTSALWFTIALYRPNRYLTALEAPLHACIVWTIVVHYVRMYREAAAGAVRPISVLVLAVLLVLNTWTRLDSVGLSAAFLVLAWLTIPRPTGPTLHRHPLAAGLPAWTYVATVAIVVAGAAAEFLFFLAAGDSVIPVSGLVKRYLAEYDVMSAMYRWSLVLLPLRISGYNLLNVFGVVAFFASLGVLARRLARRDDVEASAIRLVSIAVGAGVLIHSIATFGLFYHYFFWYLSASFVYWAVVLPFVLVWETRPQVRYAGAVVALGLVAVVAGRWWFAPESDRLAERRYEIARWMDANLPADARIGSFNAGQLGYFSNRSVVNLDGLVNHVTYLDTVLRSRSTRDLVDYLDRNGVGYVADYQFGAWNDVIEEHFAVVQAFALAAGGTFRVMSRKPASPARPD